MKILQTTISIVVLISPFFFITFFSPHKIPILLFIRLPRDGLLFARLMGVCSFAEPIRLFLFPSFLFLSRCLILFGVWTRGLFANHARCGICKYLDSHKSVFVEDAKQTRAVTGDKSHECLISYFFIQHVLHDVFVVNHCWKNKIYSESVL